MTDSRTTSDVPQVGLSDSLAQKISNEITLASLDTTDQLGIKDGGKIEEIADDSPEDPEIWRTTFQEYIDSPPGEGDLLFAADGGPVKLTISLNSGKPPFICGRAYVPNEVGCRLGWFARGQNDNSDYGWKVIMLPKCRDQVIKKLGIRTNVVYVQSLIVVRKSLSNQAFLGEVHSW